MKNLLLASALLLTACGPQGMQQFQDRVFSGGRGFSDTGSEDFSAVTGQLQIKVVDQKGQPAADVLVLVGSAEDVPFRQNFAKTDAQGVVNFAVPSVADTPVTLAKAGYPKVTYFGQSGTVLSLKLPKINPEKSVEIRGKLDGWGDLPNDGKIDFGIYLPFLNKQRLVDFEMTDLLSPTVDSFSVAGNDVDVPSNFVFPNQTETYIIFPVSFDKPIFRTPLGVPDTYNLLAVAGQFPFKKVAGALKDHKPVFEILNDLSFKRFGAIKDKSVTAALDNQNVDINQGRLAPCLNATSKNMPAGYRTLAVAFMSDTTTTLDRSLQPTDMKMLNDQNAQLGCVAGDTRPMTVISRALNYRDTGFLSLIPGSSQIVARGIDRQNPRAKNLTFSTYFDVPKVTVLNGGTRVEATRVERNGVSPQAFGVYAVLMDVDLVDNGSYKAEVMYPKWLVFGGPAMAAFELPNLPKEMAEVKAFKNAPHFKGEAKQRWDFGWLGQDPVLLGLTETLATPSTIGFDILDVTTHVSRNRFDF